MTTPSDSPVLKAIRVLTTVAASEEPLSLANLSGAVALPKPTVHRLAALLERMHLVQRDPLTRRYVVGARLQELALEVIKTGPLHANRQVLLQRLSERLGETVNLGVLDRGMITYIERVEAAWPLRMDFKPGSRVPVHCTAIGKLLLAHSPRRFREEMLVAGNLECHTNNTITNRAVLRRQLSETRKRGYSEDNEEFLAGVCCLAVPVRAGNGRVVAGLAVSAPSARMPLERARTHLNDLREFAGLIARDMEASRVAASRVGIRVPVHQLARRRPRRRRNPGA